MTNQLATLDWAGIDCHDVFLGNRHCGVVLEVSKPGRVRASFNSNGTKMSARRFADAQTAIAYLVDRKLARIAKRAGA